MKTKLFFFLVIILFKTNAQNSFNGHVITTGSDGLDGVTSIAAGDIDGDGDIDVISTSQLDKNISWYKNLDGSGTFARPIGIENNLYTSFNLYLTDIDNDTDLDILVSSDRYEEDKIFWYENTDGLGNFGSKQLIYSYVNDGKTIAVNHADIDGDGDMDVLCVTTGNNQSRWFENNNGVFTENVIASYQYSPTLISADDVNGDGTLDLIIGFSYHDKLSFFEGGGLGVFGTEIVITDVVDDLREYDFVDFDNDGDNDVLTVYDNKVAWFENLDGNGTFGVRHTIQSHFGSQSVSAIDVDNDGDLDAVVANASGDKLTWNENLDGMGDFGPELDIDSLFDLPIKIITADINGDGFDDVISTSAIDQSVDWYENIGGSGNFGKRKTIAGLTDGPWMTNTGDLDGDGYRDIVCTAYDGDKIVWFKNLDNEGLFSSQQIIGVHQERCLFTEVVDIDSDGDLDILATTRSTVKWFENTNGQGLFDVVHTVESDNLAVISAYFRDINGDGLKDIITFSTNYGVFWYENFDGTGQFGTKNIVNNTYPSNSFYPVDIDLDGDLDIVVCNSEGKVAWFLNDSLGNFGQENVLITDLQYVNSIFSNDIDNDGDNDIIAADYYKIVWYENLNGLGSFATEKIIDDENVNATNIFLFDIDGDEDLDLLASLGSSQNVVWYPNIDGFGNFGNKVNIGSGALIFNVDDIDNDGDLDVIAPSRNADKITWFENGGNLAISPNLTEDFIIYPNPSTKEITVKSRFEIIEVNIWNNLGQVVLSVKNSSEIDISTLNVGLYFIRVTDANGNTAIKKVIKK